MLNKNLESNSIYLSSHFRTIQNIYIETPEELRSAQRKKFARKEISLKFSSEKYGFLHAVLIKHENKYYALAGQSGIGKTTYGNHLNDSSNGFLANDWIVVEKNESDYYASDLNFAQNLYGEKVKLEGIIFLSFNDNHHRDAYYPNSTELFQLLDETFDNANKQETKILSKFWLSNISELPFCSVVPARGKTEQFISETITKLISMHNQLMHNVAVGIIGLGSVGSQLASQVAQISYVNNIHLYNRSHSKSVGLALDMNHAHSDKGELFVAQETMEGVFQKSNVVFLTFRDISGLILENVPERWKKISSHLRIMNEISKVIDNSHFNGTIFVVTNPVDFLTYSLYSNSQQGNNALRTFQIYGIGLELDAMRALYCSRQMGLQLGREDIRIFGNHSDTLHLETPLPETENKKLLTLIKNSSREVRKGIERTIYGPANAAERTLRAYLKGNSIHATLIQDFSHIGRLVNFKNNLPQLATEPENTEEYNQILKNNQQNTQNIFTI